LASSEVEIFGVGQGVKQLARGSQDGEVHDKDFRRGEDVAHAIFRAVGLASGAVYAGHGLVEGTGYGVVDGGIGGVYAKGEHAGVFRTWVGE
jgi:hypothetical protein